MQHEIDLWHMQRAVQLATQGEGAVEPNPMVGCVVARDAEIIGEGYHRRFGGPHAEVEALKIAGQRAAGATAYVTLEPCCHQGKTPPCTRALLAAGIRRVVVALQDPFPEVSGGGIAELRAAGLTVETGLLAADVRQLIAPYLKLVETGRPWIIAKWAMTLDGKIATRSGASRWISGPESRAIVHKLRGRVDAVLVGRQTAVRDDPLLTARPSGLRTALRIVLDTHAALSSESQLIRTANDVPVLVAVGEESSPLERLRLKNLGCEVLVCPGETHADRLDSLLAELGRRRLTNILVEGGSRVLGCMLDARTLDEVHVFVAPKLVGGAAAPSPIAGAGIGEMTAALQLDQPEVRQVDGDTYIRARCSAGSSQGSPADRESCNRDR
ncbi:MAG: bifunctional diaminohydroxyphosphoribosylaminopyrimidine deaminase/5-amino-6-(5-phosphoribosylamino)uracil reductase RibD [Planctomycetaceae bacterium]|nr:bifunctional diaminohydroxyphosphoribosylaminopyrimidine deaminase/5-amino-6-(5-phosphoribosylamino)uracil reductase RibD [Planctomycetaceae bacterium]